MSEIRNFHILPTTYVIYSILVLQKKQTNLRLSDLNDFEEFLKVYDEYRVAPLRSKLYWVLYSIFINTDERFL